MLLSVNHLLFILFFLNRYTVKRINPKKVPTGSLRKCFFFPLGDNFILFLFILFIFLLGDNFKVKKKAE